MIALNLSEHLTLDRAQCCKKELCSQPQLIGTKAWFGMFWFEVHCLIYLRTKNDRFYKLKSTSKERVLQAQVFPSCFRQIVLVIVVLL